MERGREDQEPLNIYYLAGFIDGEGYEDIFEFMKMKKIAFLNMRRN